MLVGAEPVIWILRLRESFEIMPKTNERGAGGRNEPRRGVIYLRRDYHVPLGSHLTLCGEAWGIVRSHGSTVKKGLVAEVLRFILQLYICRKDPPHQIFNITPTPHSLPMDHMFNWLWQIKHLRNTTISLTYQLCREEEWMHNSKRENISLKKVAQDVGEEINSQFIHRMDGDIIICP